MAILDCSQINVGFAMDSCSRLSIAGTGSRVILLNYSDINKALSEEAENVIASIVLKAGAKGYEVASLPDATVGEDTLSAGTYRNRHLHSVTVRIFKKSEAAKKFVNSLTDARIVAIVENNDIGEEGEVKYEVYGWDSGLKLSELTASTELTDEASYVCGLASKDSALEFTLPKSFFNTDAATTDSAIEALLTPTVTP